MLGEFFLVKSKIKKRIKGIFKNKQDFILDLGCGKKPYYRKFIKGKLISADIEKSGRVDIICDSHHIPLKKEKFDKVLCVNSFYYFSDPFRAMDEIHRVLKKDGKIVMQMPFIYPIHDAPVDKYRFTEYGIRNLLKDKFKVDKIEAIGGIFSLPSVILHSLIKGIPIISPKPIRAIVKILAAVVLYPFYFVFQLFSLLDFLDFTKRWPTYYFIIASKK